MEKSQKIILKKFISGPVYGDNDKYIKTKIHKEKNMPKEKAPCKSLSIIILDYVFKAKKKYYPQTILEECKYEPKKIKMENLIDDDLEKSSSDESDSDDNDFNDETESDDEKDNDESNE